MSSSILPDACLCSFGVPPPIAFSALLSLSQDLIYWVRISVQESHIPLRYQKSIAKALLQCRHLYWELVHPERVIYIDGDLHVNRSRLDFSVHNLGDDLNLPLLEELTGCHIVPQRYALWRRPSRKTFLVIGSILEVCMQPDSVVWGAGLIRPPEKPLRSPYRICAVRGPLTRKELLQQNIDCPEVYGDPAILLPNIYHPDPPKRHSVCLIPHVSELETPFVRAWQKRGWPWLDLRKYEHWQQCIDFLCTSETVLSSSLHGLILADCYGVPSCRLRLSSKIIGGDFKFNDYYLSFCANPPEPLLPADHSLKEWQEMILHSWRGKPLPLVESLLSSCPLPLLQTFRD